MTDSRTPSDLLERVELLTTRILGPHFPDGLEWFETPYGKGSRCARCGSSVEFVDCWNCEDGYSYHDCGEDCCACLYPMPNVRCDICRGAGSFGHCVSPQDWCEANPMRGREHVRSTAISNEAWKDSQW